MASETSAEPGGRSPETVDRLLVGACGAIWLVFLAAAAVATVGLVRLAGGHPDGGERNPSWLLYSIIVVSALIIVGAIPLLLRARRNALAERSDQSAAAAELRPPTRPVDAPTEKMRVFGVDPYAERPVAAPATPRIPEAALDRLWLRGTTSLLSALGMALTAVAVATYLLAVSSDTGAWVALAVAGVITIATPAILVFHQRMLGEMVEEAGE